jgi:hypothetical protein
MRKLIALSAALGAAPIVAIAVMQTAAPAFADTPGVSPTCLPQSANPHPTDPAGQTTNTLFCTATNPNGSGSGGSGSGGSGSSGSGSAGRTTGTSGAGTTAGGGQTSLADSSGSGASGSTPDESGRFNWASNSNAGNSGAGQPATATDNGIFGGLVGFFSTAGGLALLFGLLMLMLLVLVAIAVAAAFRRGPAKDWGAHFSRVTHRA